MKFLNSFLVGLAIAGCFLQALVLYGINTSWRCEWRDLSEDCLIMAHRRVWPLLDKEKHENEQKQ